MKKILLFLLAITAVQFVSAQVVLDTTLQSPAFVPGNVEAVGLAGGGYLTGTGQGTEFFQKYSIANYNAILGIRISTPTYVTAVHVLYGKRTIGSNPGYIKARVYNIAYNKHANPNGTNATYTAAYGPDTIGPIGTSDSLSMVDIPANGASFLEATLNFRVPVRITNDSFFVSVVLSNAPGDTLAMGASVPGGNPRPPFPLSSWFKTNKNYYYDYNYFLNASGLTGDDIDLGIFPTVGTPSCILYVTDSAVNTSCGQSNGSINLVVTGVVPPVTYSWSNGATTQNLANLAQGIYTVTVQDSTCSQTLSITINNSNGPVITERHTDISCVNLGGSITDSISGGTPPYTFLWSNGATTQNIDSLLAGTYNLTVTDNNGCAGYAIVPVDYNVAGQFFVYTSATAANCNQANGILTAQAYGGTPPYAYQWSSGQSGATATGVSSGNYTVTATDSSGCANLGYATVGVHCVSIIEGKIFNDVNGNCIYDAGDTTMPWIYVTATDSVGNTYYGGADTSSSYYIEVDAPGTYHLSASGYYSSSVCGNITLCGNPGGTITIGAPGDSSLNNNFAYQNSSGFDLTMHPGWTVAKPGFAKQYWVMPYNQSPTPFSGVATITFHYDSYLVYDSSRMPLPAVDTLNHTLTWNTTYIPSPYFDWFGGRFVCNFTVKASTPLNYNLQSEFTITPIAGDCDTANNRLIYSDPVSGSHDPNSKSVSPSGSLTQADSVLTYTIFFQNTGNDTTNFVVVRDTLSPYLDASAVKNIASSARYSSFTVAGKGILTWVFTPIYLVDSAVNVSASKGYVMFTVKRKNSVTNTDQITNRASVYFDYNTPVITNKVLSDVSFTTGVTNISKNNLFAIYPNPTSGDVTVALLTDDNIQQVTITNTLGQLISNTLISVDNNRTLQVSLPATSGMYFIHLKGVKGEYVGKVVKE